MNVINPDLERWLKDIDEKKLRVVTIICWSENSDNYGNHFYGWPWGSEKEFVKQLKQFVKDIEGGKVTFNCQDKPVHPKVKLPTRKEIKKVIDDQVRKERRKL
jgi:hypothetical protein